MRSWIKNVRKHSHTLVLVYRYIHRYIYIHTQHVKQKEQKYISIVFQLSYCVNVYNEHIETIEGEEVKNNGVQYRQLPETEVEKSKQETVTLTLNKTKTTNNRQRIAVRPRERDSQILLASQKESERMNLERNGAHNETIQSQIKERRLKRLTLLAINDRLKRGFRRLNINFSVSISVSVPHY